MKKASQDAHVLVEKFLTMCVDILKYTIDHPDEAPLLLPAYNAMWMTAPLIDPSALDLAKRLAREYGWDKYNNTTTLETPSQDNTQLN